MVKTFLPPCFADWYNCPIMQILPLLLDMEARNGEHQLTPSNFMREMLLSTEQRYERLMNPSHRSTAINSGSRSFKIMPDIIVFQNFVRGAVYSVQVSVLNIKDYSKTVRVDVDPSPYFSVKHSSDYAGSKLAPGLKFTFEVRFCPDMLQDYKHKIILVSAEETLEIPIIAIGPRPILDLPDKIVFPLTAHRVHTERTIVVKNISNVWASFILETSKGFEVQRNREVLKPDECCKVTIFYFPEKLGKVEGELKLTYETGEILYVKLEGVAEQADVNLSTKKINFIDCCLGLSQERVVTLKNDSDFIIDYRWITHDCKACNLRIRSVLKERFEDLMDYELAKDNVLEYYDIVDSEMNKEIYQRILDENKKECDLSKDPVFLNDNFVIQPISGQLWPKSKINFSIIYTPKNVDLHKSIAYLDVTGRSKPFHLAMFGACEGPKIKMNLEELDAQSIYIGSEHRYEVAFHNFGVITGTVRYTGVAVSFGGLFNCSEDFFVIAPEETKSVYIGFSSLMRGKFTETIKFEVLESQEELSFVFRGDIVCPLLNFDQTVLDFGDISVGETKKWNFNLENNTQVSIDYSVEIVPSPQHISVGDEDSSCSELLCSSYQGKVDPYTKIPFSITLTANSALDKMAELAITMWEVRQQNRTVYIHYNGQVPNIVCKTPSISIKSMFITQKYFRTLTLENKSDFTGHLKLHPSDELGYLEMLLEIDEMFIKAWDTHDFRLSVKTDVIGDMSGKIMGTFHGSNKSFTICDVVVLSRGPCIDSDLVDTNIGKVKTLTLIEKPFMLSNDSPIPAVVTVNISGPFITPAENQIHLAPEETYESHLRIYGTGAGRFRTSIKLEIDGSAPDCVVYSGEFIGASISTDPPLEPSYDMGTISTMAEFTKEIKFRNEGKASHIITLKEYDTAVQHFVSNPTPNGVPYFVVSNNQFIIAPGKDKSIFFECFAKSPCRVTTRFVCNGKKQTKKNRITKLLFDFKLIATFEVPRVTLSKPIMEFRIDIGTSHMISVLEDDITLMNHSNVPLHMDVTVDEPFYFIENSRLFNKKDVSLETGEDMTLLVTFQPDMSERKIQIKKGSMKIQYVAHPTMDKLILIGIVNYPNVLFEPTFLDFDCIPIGHSGNKLAYIWNQSPLQVDYEFKLRDDHLTISPITFQEKEAQSDLTASSYDSFADCMRVDDEYLNQLIQDDIVEWKYGEDDYCEEEQSIMVEPESSSAILVDDDCLRIAEQTIQDEVLQEALRSIISPIVAEYNDSIKAIEPQLMKVLDTIVPIDQKRQIIDIVPRSGRLAPFEYHAISVSVSPPPNTELTATITCCVAGGAASELDIYAKSGEILYHLKSNVVDFGVIPFNQVAETTFQIENFGYTKFQYFVKYRAPDNTFVAEPGWISIQPIEGTIVENGMAEITVKYFPGYPGYFETVASLEIAYFDPIKLVIKGCGVLPQFYFEFPRPLDNEQNILSYQAIADITYPAHSQCNEDYTLQIEPDYNDWEFVRYKRHYPSAKDIAMAIERKAIQRHLLANPALVTYKYANSTAIIPDLVLPPYIIDLGFVILNSERDVMIKPLKYSEATTKLFWLRVSRKGCENGFNMVFQTGQPGPFLVFKPTSKMYPQPNTEVVGHVSCVINATIKIDFEIRAIVTVPSLVFKRNSVDFGRVQCGFALRKTVFLENNGAVACSYKILIQSTSERPSNIFFTKARDGMVEAGQCVKIDIYFQPQSRSKYEWRLIVYIEANKIPLKIALRGIGFLPELEIINDKIYFEPTLPYSNANVKYVKIINRSDFPIEICFTEFDSELQHEAAIVKTLLIYYNVRKLFIPPRKVGAPLPSILLEIYTYVIDHLRAILKKKIKHEYLNLIRRLGYENNESRLYSPNSFEALDKTEISDPLEDKTPDEIQALLKENVLELKAKGYTKSMTSVPRKGSVFEIDCDPPIEEVWPTDCLKEGLMIIFYGSPLTGFVFAANKAAHLLNLHVASVDDLIYESLVRNEIFAANKVNQIINDNANRLQPESNSQVPYDFDMFDILQHQVAMIVSEKLNEFIEEPTIVKKGSSAKDDTKGKSSKKTVNKSNSTKSGKTDKREKKSKDKNETFLQIPLDILYELLVESVSKYPEGLVIETLGSVFIKKSKLALIGLLKAAGNIRYLHGIYLSVSIDDYHTRKQLDVQLKGTVSVGSNDRLQEIIEMDQEEYEQLSLEEYNFFKECYLNNRILETQRRLSERAERLGEEIQKKPSRKLRVSIKSHASKVIKSDVKSDKSKRSNKQTTKRAKKNIDNVVTAVSTRSQFMEGNLEAAEMEAFEMRFILDHWHRPQQELTHPVPSTLPTTKESVKPRKKSSLKNSKDSTHKSSVSYNSSSTSKNSHKMDGKRRKSAGNMEDEEVSPGANRKSVKILTSSEMQLREELGIPFWYFCNAHLDSNIPYPELIAQYLTEDESLREAKRLAYFATLGVSRESEQLYTVLTEPKIERPKNVSNLFVLYDCPSVGDTTLNRSSATLLEGFNNPKSSKSSKSKLGRTSSMRRSSTSLLSAKKTRKHSSKKVTHSPDKSLIARRIMQSNDEITLEVHFYPDSCGVFTHFHNVEIVTLPIPYRIYLEGKTDIPRIFMDPYMIFSKVLPGKDGHDLGISYFEKEEMFHMGAVVAQPANSRIECLVVEDNLNLINESFLPCYMSLGFIKDTSDFSLADAQITIAANNSQFLTLRGHPVLPGYINASLIITNTNNPRVNCIKLSELGTQFKVDIRPRDVFFERVLIDQTVQIDVALKNTSHIGTTWEINFKNVMDKFSISATQGYIKPLGTTYITFTYVATEYEVLPVQEVVIKFYDKNKRCEVPILEEKIKLSAEVVEVEIEFDTDVQVGDNKIGQLFSIIYTITNKSKFELKSSFLPLDDATHSHEMNVIRKSTFVDSVDTQLKPNDVTQIPIKFKINYPMEFRAVPIFKVDISDPHINRTVVDYVLRVTGKVFSSCYKLCPSSELVFSPQLVDSEVKKDIVLHNTGKYSFSFVIKNAKDDESAGSSVKRKTKKGNRSSRTVPSSVSSTKSSKASKKSKKSKKSKASRKSKETGKSGRRSSGSTYGKKTKVTTLKQGIFSITPSMGIIQPHTEAYIQVTCKTKKVGTYLEKLLFQISGVTGKYANGEPFKLQGTACVPEIDFDNIEYIFKEHLIFESQDDASCLDQIRASCIYMKIDKQFCFHKTCLSSEEYACLHFRNSGEIGVNVSAIITKDTSAFTVSPATQYIEEYSSQYFKIGFKPTMLDKYEGTLEFAVEQSASKLKIDLYGEGCLPMIEILNPAPECEIDYKLVLLDTTACRSVVLRNCGSLNAKVILGVDDPMLNIVLEPLTNNFCKHILDYDEKAFQSTVIVEILPGHSVEINVLFTPKAEVKLDTDIKVFITNNPYDCFNIHIFGQGYKEDVIIEQLDSFIATDIKSRSLTNKEEGPFTLICYNLNFGFVYINKLSKIYIRLRNLSIDSTYRFEFQPKDNVNFLPRIGHLKPLNSKEIIVTFITKVPMDIEKKLQVCKLVKIEYEHPETEDLAWDERQQCAMWISGEQEDKDDIDANVPSTVLVPKVSFNMKKITQKEEPAYAEIPESSVAMRLVVNVVADYCRYEIDKTSVTFTDTTMFEASVMEFVVENTSRVPLSLDWIVKVENFPSKSKIPRFTKDSPINIGLTKRPQTCYLGKQVQAFTGNEKFTEYSRPKSVSSRSSMFSSTFSSSLGSFHSYNDSDPIPLSVRPAKTSIPPKDRCTFSLTFHPCTPLEYQFFVYSEVPNLLPDLRPISLRASATSILPLYHFRIDPSDYLVARRGTRESCEISLEDDTKVLEFQAIGYGIPVENQFTIFNPTGEQFFYRWEKPIKERNVALFQCNKPQGSVQKGRSVVASFNFIAEKSGTFETIYYFTIENYNLRVMFLLVGHARQPCVYFENNGKNLKPTVIGIDVHDSVILKNTEDIQLTYKINHASLYTEGRLQKIAIEPSIGIIYPKNETVINIYYRPTKVGRFNFNVEFRVERMQKPLVLTIATTCYNIEPTLKLIRDYTTTDLSIDSENVIQMPVFVQKKPECCQFKIGNVGKVGYYFKWEWDTFVEDFVSIELEPKEGYVKTNSEMESLVTINAVKFLTKKNVKLELRITYGPTIPITFVCSTCKTRLKFSSTLHDFGACLAQKHNTFSNEWTLEIINYDHINYIIQVEPHDLDYITTQKKGSVLSPKQTIKVQFYFHPKEITKYSAKINILVNDKKHPIIILGEGVSMEVGLLNIRDKFLNFGAVPLGKYSKKRVQILNKTKCPVSIYFELYQRLPICIQSTIHLEADFEHLEIKPSDVTVKKKKEAPKKGRKGKDSGKSSKKSKSSRNSRASRDSKSSGNSDKSERSLKEKKHKKSKKEKKEDSKGKEKKKNKNAKSTEQIKSTDSSDEKQNNIRSSLRIRPLKWIKLYPQNSIEYTITFMPICRMPVFKEQVYCQVEDTVIPLCAIKASCIASQYSLQRSKIAFGTVILGSSNKYYTKLINSGDIGGRFKWTWKSTRESFTIKPMEGHSSPGSNTTFEVLFQPLYVQCTCSSYAKLTIENHKTIYDLELVGTCIDLPNPRDTLKFTGPVRETFIKKFTLHNSTPEPWTINPILSGEYFHIDDLIVVDAKASTAVEVTYKPLTMTQGDNFHEGNIFLPLPEGQGMLYALLGESLRPKTTEVIEKSIPSKTYNHIILDVYNWLKVTQQFTVLNQIDQPDGPKKVLYKLTGTAIVDVPPCSTKSYKWIIYTLNEGKLNFKVKFRNEATKEYICYELKLTVVKCQVLDKIVLNACARGVAEYKLRLENPLSEPTVYKMSSQCNDLHFVKEAMVLPYTEIEIPIEYKPLYPTPEFTTLFEAVSSKLGSFPYHFVLSATTAEMEQAVKIKAHLGQKNIYVTSIFNPTKTSTEFTAKLDHVEFTVEKLVVVKPNERAAIDIGFEPSQLGEVYSKLTLSSPTLGIYLFPLCGVGLPPHAQGPFTVKPSSQTAIPFKNPFNAGMTFHYKVSNTHFILQPKSEFIKARSTTRINLSCDKREIKVEDPPSLLMGKLLITCADKAYSDIEWVIYLQSGSFTKNNE